MSAQRMRALSAATLDAPTAQRDGPLATALAAELENEKGHLDRLRHWGAEQSRGRLQRGAPRRVGRRR
eukprot:5798570-Pyramimonas_sp.AAC.1